MNGIVWEITSQKLAEEKLKKAYQQLNMTLESITDGFISVDREWRITYLNKSGAKMLGMKTEKPHWRCLLGTLPGCGQTWILTPVYRDAVESGTPVHFEEYYPTALSINGGNAMHTHPPRDYPFTSGISPNAS